MFVSLIAYYGLLIAVVGVALVIRPDPRVHITTRRRASIVVGVGVAVTLIALLLPTHDSSPAVLRTRLDEFVPVWQFNEYHTIKIAAPPERVFEAIHQVRADEVFLFKTLTWIRRGGRAMPQSIMNAGDREPLVDVAVNGGFARLADDAPRELVIGTAVVAPPGVEGATTPDMFRRKLPPGFALAAMNFLVTPDGENGSFVSTETRIFANNPEARRRFAAYWRIIHPGSALIRRSWLRAVAKRATSSQLQ